MNSTENLGLTLFESDDKFRISQETQSLNKNMKVLDEEIPKKAKTDIIAKKFNPENANGAGSYVVYEGELYILPEGHEAEVTWENTSKTKIMLSDEVAKKYEKPVNGIPAADLATGVIPDVSGKANLSVIAPAFAEATVNVAGSLVTYTDGVIYLLPEGHEAGITWGNTVKTATNIAAELGGVKNAIDGMKAKNESVNLYTPQSIENIMDGYTLRNGVPQTQYGAYCYVSDYVPVSGGDDITFNIEPWGVATSGFRGAEYNANKEYIQNINNAEHTLSANAAYIRFTVSKLTYGSAASDSLKYINEHLVISNGGYAPVDMSEGVFLVEDTVRKTDTYFVDASGSEMLILSKMAGVDGKDLGIKLKKFSNNDAYQFCSFGTVSNPSQFVSNKPTEYVEFMATGEDWFSPCKVYAVNNTDGDYPTANNWSGGFHKVDGINTSRLVSLDIYFDGRKQDDFVGYCNTIDIVVVHNLTASNTFKSDGTGREVIRETIKIHFENGKVDVTTEFKALEDVTMSVWYFLQAHHKANGFGTNGIRYIGSDANRSINSMDESSNSGDKYCRIMRLLANAMQIDVSIDDFDAGRFSKCEQSYSAFVSFYTSYSKAYFNVVNNTTTPVTLNAGDSITARGSYKFGIFE